MSSFSTTSASPRPPRAPRFAGKAGVDTLALHGGFIPDSDSAALVPPLVQSTTYVQPEVGATGVHAYSRVSNPTVDALERQLGALEDAPPAVCFSTGLAAETALFLSLLRAGDHAVVGAAIYGGTVRLFRQLLAELGVSATFVNTANPAEVSAALTPRTKLVFIETPANPTLELTDIEAVARITKAAGVPLAVDNTFLTPVLQKPLELGADISLYSTTKHIEGHSTALGGSITTRDGALLDRLRFIRKCTGAIQTPFNAWLTSRGIKTLPLRVRQHSRNALEVARWLEGNQAVARVNFPGLESFPQKALADRQHAEALHGGVVSFELTGGTEAGRAVLNGVKLCSLVEHIGGVETLITHPATMTHADVPAEQRRAAGIADGLVRLSVGLEEVSDIIADLDQAIAGATKPARAPRATNTKESAHVR